MGFGGEAGLWLGVAAALLQLIGYVVYLRDGEIEPNPVTWLMFAYGTMLLTALEWDSNAGPAELLLPLTCSFMAVFVAGRCWRRAYRRNPDRLWPREWWPEDWRDRAAFQIDLVLTGLYLAAAMLVANDWIAPDLKAFAVVLFLVAGNLTTVSAFFPLIRNVFDNPQYEKTLPWAIWTIAYATLGVATFVSQATIWTALMLYPLLNAALHGSVALLSRKSRKDLRLQRLSRT